MKKITALALAILLSLSLICAVTAATDEYAPSSLWKIEVNSDRGSTIRNLIDGNINSYWHSA
ncbi:MAG: hypothetical protein IKL74_02520, partial [Clostridia bacterium]|nr:hypothetical protein [Clostridia bacterium]